MCNVDLGEVNLQLKYNQENVGHAQEVIDCVKKSGAGILTIQTALPEAILQTTGRAKAESLTLFPGYSGLSPPGQAARFQDQVLSQPGH